jgi:hypothetical protein
MQQRSAAWDGESPLRTDPCEVSITREKLEYSLVKVYSGVTASGVSDDRAVEN